MLIVEDDGCLSAVQLEQYAQRLLQARREDRVMKVVYWLFGLAAVVGVLRVIFGEPYGGK